MIGSRCNGRGAGLDKRLSPHCLSALVRDARGGGRGGPEIPDAGRHVYQSTTSLYTAVSGDFANTMMRQAIDLARLREPLAGEERHRD